MGIKKKLGLGAASAALGLSLIGGGTWAAFNDVETLSNSVAAGTLDLDITANGDTLTTFALENLKPGDEFTRSFKLNNNGSLAIKEVWLDVLPANFTNGTNEFVNDHGQTDNDALQFLDQFAVEVLISGSESTTGAYNLIEATDNVTLKDLAEGTGLPTDLQLDSGRINLTPIPGTNGDQWAGIPVDPTDYEIVDFKISMIDNDAKVTDPASEAFGEYYQNRYQGDSIDLGFQFEATQWNGIMIDQNDYVDENEQSFPEPENTDPVQN